MCAGGTPNGGAGRKAGSLGALCPVCGRSAGVSCRTRLRWPTPVRLRRTVVSKETITGAVLMEELPGRRTFPPAFLFFLPPSLKVSSDFLVSSAAGFPFPCLSDFPLPSGSSRFFPFFFSVVPSLRVFSSPHTVRGPGRLCRADVNEKGIAAAGFSEGSSQNGGPSTLPATLVFPCASLRLLRFLC